MRGFAWIAAALLLVPFSGLAAQDAGSQKPSEDEVRRAGIILQAFQTVVNSEEADPALKRRLFSCLYSNSLDEIGVAAGKVLAANEQLDASDPKNVYGAAAVACGVTPAGSPDAAASPTVKGR